MTLSRSLAASVALMISAGLSAPKGDVLVPGDSAHCASSNRFAVKFDEMEIHIPKDFTLGLDLLEDGAVVFSSPRAAGYGIQTIQIGPQRSVVHDCSDGERASWTFGFASMAACLEVNMGADSVPMDLATMTSASYQVTIVGPDIERETRCLFSPSGPSGSK